MHNRYNINHYLYLSPSTISYQEMIHKLENEYGISSAKFNQDRNICLGDPTPVPDNRLNIYAKILQVTLKDLKF